MTHPPHGHQPPPPNHLAAELRGILDDLHDSEHGDVPRHLVRERLLRLAEHVERLGAQPVEVDASTELTASFGLEPEQEIRTRALEIAARYTSGFGWGLCEIADGYAAYIRDGRRP